MKRKDIFKEIIYSMVFYIVLFWLLVMGLALNAQTVHPDHKYTAIFKKAVVYNPELSPKLLEQGVVMIITIDVNGVLTLSTADKDTEFVPLSTKDKFMDVDDIGIMAYNKYYNSEVGEILFAISKDKNDAMIYSELTGMIYYKY